MTKKFGLILVVICIGMSAGMASAKELNPDEMGWVDKMLWGVTCNSLTCRFPSVAKNCILATKGDDPVLNVAFAQIHHPKCWRKIQKNAQKVCEAVAKTVKKADGRHDHKACMKEIDGESRSLKCNKHVCGIASGAANCLFEKIVDTVTWAKGYTVDYHGVEKHNASCWKKLKEDGKKVCEALKDKASKHYAHIGFDMKRCHHKLGVK